jgi:hypothetical protein
VPCYQTAVIVQTGDQCAKLSKLRHQEQATIPSDTGSTVLGGAPILQRLSPQR